MKLKEKFQRFWTLSKSRQGFTLVELIVVIAILAILAGVAIPVYNGYIKKAQTAADQTLLDSVNTAFAAACLEEGISHLDLSANSAKMPLVNGAVDVENVKPAALQEAFAFYYTGNENSTFNTFTSLTYVKAMGMFAATDSLGTVTLTYETADGKTVSIAINPEDVDNVNASVFKEMGVDTLLGKLDSVTGFAGSLDTDSDAIATVTSDINFLRSFAGYLGVEGNLDNMDAAKLAEEIGKKSEGLSDEEAAQMSGNALVLFAAQNSNIDKNSASELLAGDAKGDILNTLRGTNGVEADPGKALADAALAYGVITAYAHSTGNVDVDSMSPIDALDILGQKEFKEYAASAEGQEAIEGYLSAMNMINSGTKDNSVAGDVLSNGFGGNEALKDLIEGALGGNN